MKLGAIPPSVPVVSSGEDIVVDGSGVQDAIKTAANVAAATSQGAPGVVPGQMVQTADGQVFQPNPTTVTVVPPARSIQVVGEPEEVKADEDLEVSASSGIPSVLPAAPIAQPVQQGGYMMQQPGFMPQMFQGGYMMQQPNLNMTQYPAIYAASQPQPAQIYTSGVPGAPPTIAVSTDNMQMNGFMMPNAPKPMRNNITLKRKSVSFGGSNDQGESSGTTDSSVKINVIKGT